MHIAAMAFRKVLQTAGVVLLSCLATEATYTQQVTNSRDSLPLADIARQVSAMPLLPGISYATRLTWGQDHDPRIDLVFVNSSNDEVTLVVDRVPGPNPQPDTCRFQKRVPSDNRDSISRRISMEFHRSGLFILKPNSWGHQVFREWRGYDVPTGGCTIVIRVWKLELSTTSDREPDAIIKIPAQRPNVAELRFESVAAANLRRSLTVSAIADFGFDDGVGHMGSRTARLLLTNSSDRLPVMATARLEELVCRPQGSMWLGTHWFAMQATTSWGPIVIDPGKWGVFVVSFEFDRRVRGSRCTAVIGIISIGSDIVPGPEVREGTVRLKISS